ncbi:hypothetical protein PoB_004999000 [Plakobranchus ocellatus]|uniref:Uncharacterized protein n=1 Tax=Plakobranchus ocellatus TaxID=259542 RepID=A0AAV4BSR4_9GAST|nr:hypothetical protein PoB_004999000 [Plakobranchus ocellatus]
MNDPLFFWCLLTSHSSTHKDQGVRVGAKTAGSYRYGKQYSLNITGNWNKTFVGKTVEAKGVRRLYSDGESTTIGNDVVSTITTTFTAALTQKPQRHTTATAAATTKRRGIPACQDAGGGAGTLDRRVPADLRADSLATVSPTPRRNHMGVGGTVDSESALRFAGTLLSQVCAPPPAPNPDEEPKSPRSH